jgi:hypothetical protein
MMMIFIKNKYHFVIGFIVRKASRL